MVRHTFFFGRLASNASATADFRIEPDHTSIDVITPGACFQAGI